MGNQINVLSIDGGGIRGIIPTMILAEIEKRTRVPSYYRFQVRLDEGNDDIGDASRTNIRVLKLLAESAIRDNDGPLQMLCQPLLA